MLDPLSRILQLEKEATAMRGYVEALARAIAKTFGPDKLKELKETVNSEYIKIVGVNPETNTVVGPVILTKYSRSAEPTTWEVNGESHKAKA